VYTTAAAEPPVTVEPEIEKPEIAEPVASEPAIAETPALELLAPEPVEPEATEPAEPALEAPEPATAEPQAPPPDTDVSAPEISEPRPQLPQRAPRPLGAPREATADFGMASSEGALVEPVAGIADDEAGLPEAEDRQSISRNRRLYRRVALDVEFELDGIRSQLIDLSIEGFAATGPLQFQPQAVVPASVRLSIDGVNVATQMQARVVYTSQLRTGGRFVDLTPSQIALLRYLVTWRGKPAGALNTANLLDAISGVPERDASQPPSPVLELPGRRTPWWARLFGRLLGRRRA
jgi:hypothetical protein